MDEKVSGGMNVGRTTAVETGTSVEVAETGKSRKWVLAAYFVLSAVVAWVCVDGLSYNSGTSGAGHYFQEITTRNTVALAIMIVTTGAVLWLGRGEEAEKGVIGVVEMTLMLIMVGLAWTGTMTISNVVGTVVAMVLFPVSANLIVRYYFGGRLAWKVLTWTQILMLIIWGGLTTYMVSLNDTLFAEIVAVYGVMSAAMAVAVVTGMTDDKIKWGKVVAMPILTCLGTLCALLVVFGVGSGPYWMAGVILIGIELAIGVVISEIIMVIVAKVVRKAEAGKKGIEEEA